MTFNQNNPSLENVFIILHVTLFSTENEKLQFHNILDKCRILGNTSFSLLLSDFFFPENYEIPLLTEMSKNDAEIERV